MTSFNAIEYLGTLTGYPFDRKTLEVVAVESGLVDVEIYSEITEEMRDKALIGLLERILLSPRQTASKRSKHGDFEVSVGSVSMSAGQIEAIRRRLKMLYDKYELEDTIDSGEMRWINEDKWEC